MALKAMCLFVDLCTRRCDWKRKKQKNEALATGKITIRVSRENLWLHLQYYFSSRNSEVSKLIPWASPLTMLCFGPHSGFLCILEPHSSQRKLSQKFQSRCKSNDVQPVAGTQKSEAKIDASDSFEPRVMRYWIWENRLDLVWLKATNHVRNKY